MFDRHWFGDVALAVLLAIPTTALVAAGHDVPQRNSTSSAVSQTQHQRPGVDSRFSLFAPN